MIKVGEVSVLLEKQLMQKPQGGPTAHLATIHMRHRSHGSPRVCGSDRYASMQVLTKLKFSETIEAPKPFGLTKSHGSVILRWGTGSRR